MAKRADRKPNPYREQHSPYPGERPRNANTTTWGPTMIGSEGQRAPRGAMAWPEGAPSDGDRDDESRRMPKGYKVGSGSGGWEGN